MLAALVAGVAILALLDLAHGNEGFLSYTQGLSARAKVANDIRSAVDDRAIAARNLVLVTKAADLQAEKLAVNTAHRKVQDNLALLKKMLSSDSSASPQAHKLVGDIEKVEQSYGPLALAIVDLALTQRHEQAITRMNNECRPLLAALIQATNAYAAYTGTRTHAMEQASADNYASQRNQLAALCLFAVAAAIAAGSLITRSITGPLDEAVQAANRIAAGDLSGSIEVSSSDETGRLLSALRDMQQSLVKTVQAVRGNADSVSVASAQIAQGNNDLSQRTEEQASALQQTAASMEQLGSTVHHNAQNAQQAGSLAAAASQIAVQGGAVVGEVVTTMQEINDSARQISEIIGVIDGIAFQTNILALNAAVEAARAGEQGRGFAVVASEVRNLAQRSAEAAKEIKALILASVGRVAQGTALVDRAGHTMQEVVASVQRVSDIVAEISAASNEQSLGMEQIGQAVIQMDQTTQQNAALVEESAAAAASLKNQAQELVDAVAVFRFDQPDATAFVERRGPDRATNVARIKPSASNAMQAKPSKALAAPRLHTNVDQRAKA